MKLKILIALLFVAVLPHYGSQLLAQRGLGAGIIPVAIYGDDDRFEASYQADARIRAMAASTVALFKDPALVLNKEKGVFAIKAETLEKHQHMAKGQRFIEQPAVAFCSGALIGDDIILTAGHCVPASAEDPIYKHIKIAFGYAVSITGSNPTELPQKEVYSCRKVLKYATNPRGKDYKDYAVIQLDRKVAGHTPLAINRNQKLIKDTPLFIIGYPTGLPVKVAGNAKIRNIPPNAPYFVTDLDAFGGNSGSPVFNARTYMIEGILVRGDWGDYYPYASGSVVTIYGQEQGHGNHVTKIQEIQDVAPVNEFERFLQAEQKQQTGGSRVKAAPVIYMPGSQPGIQPAIYLPDPAAPQPVRI